MTQTKTQPTAELNDMCRKAMGVAWRLMQTLGISALPMADQAAIREKGQSAEWPGAQAAGRQLALF